MKTNRKPPPRAQQHNEQNPYDVAFALYCSLGAGRHGIISRGVGKELWERLMTATDRMVEDTPLFLVCFHISALLKKLFREDAAGHVDPDRIEDACHRHFLHRLRSDEQLLAAVETMLVHIESTASRRSPLPPARPGHKQNRYRR